MRGHREVLGLLTCSKNFKMPFLKDIENPRHKVTLLGLETHHFFFLSAESLVLLKHLNKCDY